MDSKSIRSDYMNVGLNGKECLKILDTSKTKDEEDTLQIVVGDHSGSIESLRLKQGKLYEHIFKTLPGPNQKVSAVEVVGTKMLLAIRAQTIQGINRKGKQFFLMELSYLTEPIQHLKFKWPTDIFVCGHYIYNHYSISSGNSSGESNTVQLKDSYISPGRVTAMCVLQIERQGKTDIISVLATEDRLIRILQDSSCAFELETNGIPSCLTLLPNLKPNERQGCFLYGSSDGKITMVALEDLSTQPSFQWEIPEESSTKNMKAAIECMVVSSSGKELVVGRSDGCIEVWGFDGSLNIDGSENIDQDSAPVLRFTHSCNESITSVCISHDGNLLVVSTFAGSVFGIEWKGSVRRNISKVAVEDMQLRIEMLKEECQQLEASLVLERAKYLQTNEFASKAKKLSTDVGISALPTFAIKDSLILHEDASYILSIETAVPIDVVFLQSDVPIDVIDSEKNSAVVSFSESDSQEVLVTFRCQSNTTRIEVKIRSIEGQYGNMRVYVISQVTPKTCQLKMYPMKPLSLHRRAYGEVFQDNDQKSKLEITGDFSVHEAYNWVYSSLPEVPEKVVSPDDVTEFHFKSTLSSTSLSCQASKGRVMFESDNVSSISILKDFITRQATSKGIRIEVSTSLAEDTISSALIKLFPLIKRLVKCREFNRLQTAVQELSQTDSVIAEELMNDLKNDYQDRHHLEMISLDRLLGLITDLVIDQHKLQGKASKTTLTLIRNKVEELLPTVEAFFAKDIHENEGNLFVKLMLDFWSSIQPK